MEYQEKLKIANEYLSGVIEVDWEDLPDVNSLHDCNTKEDIIEACKERIANITEIADEDLSFLDDDEDDDE